MSDRTDKALQQGLAQLGLNFEQLRTDAASDDSPYYTIRKTFGLHGVTVPYRRGYGPVATGKEGYITNDLGQILFGNGVVADPSTGDIFYPNPASGIDPSDVPGSPEWLHKIQTSWSEAKANQWRKKLVSMGYDTAVTGGIAPSGGMAMDLIEGLRQYHATRYLNYGTVQKLTPKGTKHESPHDVKKSLDFDSLVEETRGWGQVPFGEDLTDEEAKYFANRMVTVLSRLQRQHPEWSQSQLSSGATTRVQKEFLDVPEVADETDKQDDLEGDTTLRKHIVSAFQLGSI